MIATLYKADSLYSVPCTKSARLQATAEIFKNSVSKQLLLVPYVMLLVINYYLPATVAFPFVDPITCKFGTCSEVLGSNPCPPTWS